MDKFEQLQIYDAKQNLIGKLFDFYIDTITDRILISKYYDIPNRTEIIIPDFVDGFQSHKKEGFTDNRYGAFYKCRYIEKIIMHSNISGKLTGLFNKFLGERLDLTDFDTCNITDMSYMFAYSKTAEINLGDKFDTSNVKDMSNMFFYHTSDKINLGTKFNTSNVNNMESIFGCCKCNHLKLGDNFDTSNVRNMSFMFYKYSSNSLKLDGRFTTKNVIYMKGMFQSCQIGTLDLGENFDTSNTNDMNSMFNSSTIEILNIGNKFELFNVPLCCDMFDKCRINKIIAKDELEQKTINIIERKSNIKVTIELSNSKVGNYYGQI